MADSTLAGLTQITTANIAGTELLYTDDGASDLKMTTTQVQTFVNQVPQNSRSADYSTVITDANKFILHPVGDNNARTFTIDGSVTYPVGTWITFVNAINTLSIAIGTDAMHLAGGSSTGTRALAPYGIATALKYATGLWIISGTNLT